MYKPASLFFNWILILLFCTSCLPEKPTVDKKKEIRVSTDSEPKTFDPRLVRDLLDTTYIQMFYEGLMRGEEGGKLMPALAEKVTISPDQKKYTFHIRLSEWSDGQPVTAHDFAETWKSVLDPSFPAPNAYQLYVIKGAKAAKEGQISLDEVGINVLDDKILEVELENPTPYFLHLTSTYFLYPTHRSMRENAQSTPVPVTNGPFQLDQQKTASNEWVGIPNPYYWDRQAVKIDQIKIIKLDNSTAVKLYDQHELDWMGSPLSTIPIDILPALKQRDDLKIVPAAGVYFLRLNTEQPPLDNAKLRKALALALNRTDLIEHVLQGNQIPAKGYLPIEFSGENAHYQDNDLKTAASLLQEALSEKNAKLDSLPNISICYSNNGRAHKIAQVLQQQWQEALGIDIELQSCESKVLYDRLKKHDYQISIGSWFADILDPISFLDVFKHKDNGTNNTQWENPKYIAFIDESAKTGKAKDRLKLLKQAEEVLIDEMPIIPLYFSTYNYMQKPNVKGVYFSELGYLDFKKADLIENK